MPGESTVHLSFEVEVVGGYNPPALQYLELILHEYAGALVTCAEGIERSERPANLDIPEITASIVGKAKEALNNRSRVEPAPKSLTEKALQVISPLSAASASISGAYLHSPLQGILLGILLIVALSSTFLTVFGLGGRGHEA